MRRQAARRSASFLAQLFGERKAKLFGSDTWPARPLLAHGPVDRLPDAFRSGDLSSFDRLAACIEQPISRGIEGLPSGYRGDAFFLGQKGKQQLYSTRSASASRLFQAGLNVWFYEFRTESIEPWVAEIAGELGIPNECIRLYAFAAPGGGANGTDPHWDGNDVIHIQISGRKTMRLAPNPFVDQPDIAGIARAPFSEDLVAEFPGELPRDAPTEWETVDLRPGTVLYFPRGYWHDTIASTDSFAVGIGLYWPTALDVVVPYLKTLLREKIEWRQPLFGALKDRQTRERSASRIAKLLGDLDLSDPEGVARRAIARGGGVESRFALESADLRFVGMFMDLTVRRNGSSAEVTLATHKGNQRIVFDAPIDLAPLIRWIGRRRSFSRTDLEAVFPRVERGEIDDVLKLFLRQGAIQFDPRSQLDSATRARSRSPRPSSKATGPSSRRRRR